MKSAVFADTKRESGMMGRVLRSWDIKCVKYKCEDPSQLCWALRAVLINLFDKMLILYFAAQDKVIQLLNTKPVFFCPLVQVFFLVIICHPQGLCVHILDT